MRVLSPTILSWLACRLAFCAMLSACGAARGEEDGLALLVNAVKNSGDRQIQSGEFAYTQHIVTDPPSPAQIKAMVEQSRDSIRKNLEAAGGNEKRRQRLLKSLDEVEESITSQMKRNADRVWQHRFVRRASEDHVDQYAEFFPTDTESNREDHTQIVLLRPGLSVSRHHRTLTNISTTGVYLGQEPQRLGRLMGVLAQQFAGKEVELIRSLRDTVTSIEVEKVGSVQDNNTRQLTCRFETAGKIPTHIVIHVDPSRGYVTPLVRESDEEGNVLRQWTAEDYFQPQGSELWFPRSATYREFAKLFGKNRTEHYAFDDADVALNTKIPDERLAMPLKKNSTLLDNRTGANITYRVKDEFKLSLDAVENLETLPGLERQ